jgi:hypothetical protein
MLALERRFGDLRENLWEAIVPVPIVSMREAQFRKTLWVPLT